MKLSEIDAIVRRAASDDVRVGAAVWRFQIGAISMTCAAEPALDRLRLLAPIVEVDGLPRELLPVLLEANFHTALDARYAINEGQIYSAFVHPLSSLTEAQLGSAIQQVASLVSTFGTTFSSGELVFSAPGQGKLLN